MTISLAQAILTASRSMPADNGYALMPDAALRVLIEHAQGVPLPLARGEPPEAPTLRDQFAMHAPLEPISEAAGENGAGQHALRHRTRMAYRYADQMLIARACT